MANLKSFNEKILTIGNEIEQNKGILPDKYQPIAELLKLLLKIAKIFTPDNVDAVIDKIILAIELFENE
jgi:hypothetical protein